MSTAAHTATSTRVDVATTHPMPFTRLLHLELRKLTDTRASRGVILVIVIATVLAMGLTMWVDFEDGVDLVVLLIAATTPQAALLPVLAVLTAANEWSQRTGLVTFVQEPRRMRVMAAKAVAVVLLGLAVLVVTVLLAVAAHALSMALAGGRIDVALTPALLLNAVVQQVQGVLFGFALGTLLLSPVLGIVALFVIPMVSSLIFTLTPWLQEHGAWFDRGQALLPLSGAQWLTGTQWAQFAATTAIWVLIPLVLGLWRVSRKEVQ